MDHLETTERLRTIHRTKKTKTKNLTQNTKDEQQEYHKQKGGRKTGVNPCAGKV